MSVLSNTSDDEENLEAEEVENLEIGSFALLNEIVRDHYMNYLKKLLIENLKSWYELENAGKRNDADFTSYVDECAVALEEKAIRACRVALLYQRKMVKIIAGVRRCTNIHKLDKSLQRCLLMTVATAAEQKENAPKSFKDQTTQTLHVVSTENILKKYEKYEKHVDDYCSQSLQRKIDWFQDQYKTNNQNELQTKRRKMAQHIYEPVIVDIHQQRQQRQQQQQPHYQYQQLPKQKQKPHWSERKRRKGRLESTDECSLTPPSPNATKTITTTTTTATDVETATAIVKLKTAVTDESRTEFETKSEVQATNDDHENDAIAKELALLFSEEKTELDELFGIDPNEITDDPQINKILNEIENAKSPTHHVIQNYQQQQQQLKQQQKQTQSNDIFMQRIAVGRTSRLQLPTATTSTSHILMPLAKQEQNHHHQQHQQQQQQYFHDHHLPAVKNNFFEQPIDDLRKSIWPCELFMQRRRLTEILNRLIEGDIRCFDRIKWQFTELFGEDSDDEFATCSPSLELDEILLCSCIKRISPWIVKYLMKPFEAGLIGNRYLFKKLAKKLANGITLQNQYPDELVIKRTIEELFCEHGSINTNEELERITNLTVTL